MGVFSNSTEALNSVFVLLCIVIGGFVLSLFFWWATRENSGNRGGLFCFGHFIILALGWLVGNLPGIFLISVPLLLFFYYLIFHYAMVIVPTATPECWKERWQRFKFLIWYCWGFQYPVWVVTDSSGRTVEQRIKGNQFVKYFAPGMILAQSHQAVGLTSGIAFSGVKGPGVVFTNAFERPFGVVDLRTQLRTSLIDVVSSDGIPYKARLFTSFAVDREKWDQISYLAVLQKNQLLKGGNKPDHEKGSYPFSSPRLLALLSTTGIKSSFESGPEHAGTTWDERILYQIEQAAREVLSQCCIDELWLPKNDHKGANAMDDIASRIRNKCAFLLQQRGARLYAARIVNFEFSTEQLSLKNKEINPNIRGQPTQIEITQNDFGVTQEQISVWGADWQREATQIRAQGEAEAELMRQEARAYAHATLLTAIADAMEKTRQLHPDLPKRVIAMSFINALEELVKHQPGEGEKQDIQSALFSLKRMFRHGFTK